MNRVENLVKAYQSFSKASHGEQAGQKYQEAIEAIQKQFSGSPLTDEEITQFTESVGKSPYDAFREQDVTKVFLETLYGPLASIHVVTNEDMPQESRDVAWEAIDSAVPSSGGKEGSLGAELSAKKAERYAKELTMLKNHPRLKDQWEYLINRHLDRNPLPKLESGKTMGMTDRMRVSALRFEIREEALAFHVDNSKEAMPLNTPKQIEAAYKKIDNNKDIQLIQMFESFRDSLPEGLHAIVNDVQPSNEKASSARQWLAQNPGALLLILGLRITCGIPPEIAYFTGLLMLNVENKQSFLPPEVGKLSHLQNLTMTGNGLGSIPKEIDQLTELKVLDLSQNKLTSVPKEMGKLPKLKKLNLSDNELTSVPKEMAKLSNLEELDLSGNELESVPEEITKLDDGIVNLSGNPLTQR